jgi:conserved oligomeric Golgi complex subunit 4
MEDSKTTSCVDDVFFILKSSIQRGLSTGDPDCLCVLINSISKSFELDFMSKLQHQLSILFQGKEEVQLKQIIPILNNIDKSILFMQRLCDEVERELVFAFGHCSPLSHEQIKACLGLCNDFASKCDIVLKVISINVDMVGKLF